jgi:HlyD family secretion protein
MVMTVGRWIFAALVVAAVGFATFKGLQPRPPPAPEVTVTSSKKTTVTRLVTAAGHLQAVQTVKVSSNVTGDLISLSVKEGDLVKKNQVLAQIDRRAYEASVQQYRAAVAAAKSMIDQLTTQIAQDGRDLDRVKRLVADKLASDSDLEKAQTALDLDQGKLAAQKQQVASNQGQLESALYNLSRTTLVAPLEGTILELDHKVGERIRGSDFSEDVVLLMGGLDAMEVKAEVGEHEVVAIKEGDEATIDIDAIPDHQFKGRVAAVGKNAQIKNQGTDAEVTTFFVRVALLDPTQQVLPGMSTAVSIATATRENVVTVPIQAVTSREAKKKESKAQLEGSLAVEGGKDAKPAEAKPAEQKAGEVKPAADAPPTLAATGKPKPVKVVFVLKGDKVEMREVKTGIASRTDVEIVDGLAEGEKIVEGPYRTLARELQDGQAVKEQKKDAPGKGGDPKGPPGGRS